MPVRPVGLCCFFGFCVEMGCHNQTPFKVSPQPESQATLDTLFWHMYHSVKRWCHIVILANWLEYTLLLLSVMYCTCYLRYRDVRRDAAMSTYCSRVFLFACPLSGSGLPYLRLVIFYCIFLSVSTNSMKRPKPILLIYLVSFHNSTITNTFFKNWIHINHVRGLADIVLHYTVTVYLHSNPLSCCQKFLLSGQMCIPLPLKMVLSMCKKWSVLWITHYW